LPLCAALVFLAGARFLDIPGGAFMGAALASAAVRLSWARAQAPPRALQFFARLVLGLTIGIPVTGEALRMAQAALLPIVLAIGGLIALSFLSAWLSSKISGLDFTTSLCASSPGAASTMVVLSEDLGGQSSLVAVLHTFRIILIVVCMPGALGIVEAQGGAFAGAGGLGAASGISSFEYYGKLSFLVAAGIPLAYFFRRRKIPAAEIMAGILVAGVLNPLALHLQSYPLSWQIFSIWILGTNIGCQMTRESLKALRRHIFVCGVLTALLVAAGFLLGALLYMSTSLDLITSILGSCPGGMDAMILLAGDMGANVPLVATMHTARQILIMFIMPFFIRRLITKKGASP
jgi:membrane AbrB-like protein